MAFAESTERPRSGYRVPAYLRVREEDFGLLFYDTRTTGLTFVKSGDRLACLGPPEPPGARLVCPTGTGGPEVARVLEGLVGKGLLEPPLADEVPRG
jgi:putative mycofactocin binding protein MftB